MISKGVMMALVGFLLLALVGGSAFILFRPDDAAAAQSGPGYTRGDAAGEGEGNGSQGEGQNRGQAAAEQGGQGFGGGNGSGRGRQEVTEPSGQGLADHPSDGWATLEGPVAGFEGDELTVQTNESSVTVHLGPEWYWDTEGIALAEGDRVAVTGFYEGDKFEVAQIENLTTGDIVTLRDETGRPLWAGRGGRGGGGSLES